MSAIIAVGIANRAIRNIRRRLYNGKFGRSHDCDDLEGGIGRSAASRPECRSLDVDPFSIEFFDDPYPAHELLREAGPVVHLDKWTSTASPATRRFMPCFNDPATFCSSRGVGLSDFAKEKPWRPPSIILEADPPAHTRTRAVLSQVLSPTVMKQVRERFAAAADAKVDELLAAAKLRCHRRSGGSLSAVGVSRCGRA